MLGPGATELICVCLNQNPNQTNLSITQPVVLCQFNGGIKPELRLAIRALVHAHAFEVLREKKSKTGNRLLGGWSGSSVEL